MKISRESEKKNCGQPKRIISTIDARLPVVITPHKNKSTIFLRPNREFILPVTNITSAMIYGQHSQMCRFFCMTAAQKKINAKIWQASE